MVLRILTILAAVLLASVSSQQISAPCNTTAPPNVAPPGWILQPLSAAFMQIYRHQSIRCSGFITSWRFRTTTPNKAMKPVLSVWEQTGNLTNRTFNLVGTNNINGPLTPLPDGWYQYDVPDVRDQIQVDAQKLLYLGVFYPAITADDYMGISYLARIDPNPNPNYSNQNDSTVVGRYSLSEIVDTITRNSNGALPFNSSAMSYDLRRPYLQAFVEATPVATTTTPAPTTPTTTTVTTTTATTPPAPITTTPPTTQAPIVTTQPWFPVFSTQQPLPFFPPDGPWIPNMQTFDPSQFIFAPETTTEAFTTVTRRRRTTEAPPTTPAPTTQPPYWPVQQWSVPTCLVPHWVENGYPVSTSRDYQEGLPDPGFFPGDVIAFKCEPGYRMIGSSIYTCRTDGSWEGDSYCGVSSIACYLPKPNPGPCDNVRRKWFFDRDNRTCKWFFYGGCGGNANRFDSYEQCMDVCGYVVYGSKSLFQYKPVL